MIAAADQIILVHAEESKAMEAGPTDREHDRKRLCTQPIIMMPAKLQAAGD